MTITRRELGRLTFLGALLAAVAAAPVAFLTACVAATVAVAIIASFGKILTLLQSDGIVTNPTLLAAVQAALAAFKAAYDAFQSGTGTAAKLAAAAQAALDSLQAFFTATSIGGPLAIVVIALADIILSTLEGFLPQPLPTPQPARIAGRVIPITPKARTRTAYVNDWNAACVANGHAELGLK